MTTDQKWQRSCARVFEFAKRELGKHGDRTRFMLIGVNPNIDKISVFGNACPHEVSEILEVATSYNHDALLAHEASGEHGRN